MNLVITRARDGAPGDWSVWVTLDDHDPLEDAFGFVVGRGETRDDAIADAVVELEAAVVQLQGPISVIEERILP